jgi:hypothetical protein
MDLGSGANRWISTDVNPAASHGPDRLELITSSSLATSDLGEMPGFHHEGGVTSKQGNTNS